MCNLSFILMSSASAITGSDKKIWIDWRHCACRRNVLSKYKAKEKSQIKRIINGKPFRRTDEIDSYPWMAYIQNTPVLHQPPNTDGLPYGCAGAIISKYSILTAGHCICVDQYHQRVDRTDPSYANYPITCQAGDINLNDDRNNKINVRVGITETPLYALTPAFNDEIEAYLYNYNHPREVGFSDGGDLGIIIARRGLATVTGPYDPRPICLPYVPSDGKRRLALPNVRVKFAGWGRSYDEKTSLLGQIKTSCQTNEARTLFRDGPSGDFENVPGYHNKPDFLSCNVLPILHGRPFCIPMSSLAPGLDTLASTADIVDLYNIPTLRQTQDQIDCERYYGEAIRLWLNSRAWPSQDIALQEFAAQIDRIVVKNPSESHVIRICYNLGKVARYGVCHTYEAEPRHWGFCSSSCAQATTSLAGSTYQEAEFVMHENIRDPNEAMARKLLCS